MALADEDPKDVALALLLGWRLSDPPSRWYRLCTEAEYAAEPSGDLKGTHYREICLIQPTSRAAVIHDILTPEVTK
jgi:hypothetical protein